MIKSGALPPTLASATEAAEALIAPRGALATATLAPAGDGIAYAARLIHRAMSDLGGREPALVELGTNATEHVALRTRVHFFARLARLQSLR